MNNFAYRSLVFGQYFMVVMTCLLTIPAVLFWALTALCATAAERLARKRYGMKGEGTAYHKMLSQDIAKSVFEIKDPVMASHQEFPQGREEDLSNNPDEKVDSVFDGEVDEEDSRSRTPGDYLESSEENPEADKEEPSERSLNS